MDDSTNKRNSCLGYIFAVFCALTSAASYALIKMFQDENVKTVVARGGLQYLCIIPVMHCKKVDIFEVNLKTTGMILLRGFIASFCVIFLNMALTYISVGDATAIVYCFPVLVLIFARIFLKEKFGFLQVIFTAVTFVGLILIAEPSFLFGGNDDTGQKFESQEGLRFLGIVLSFLAAATSAFDCVLLRQIGNRADVSLTMFYFSIQSVVIACIYLAAIGRLSNSCLNDLVYAIASAVLAVIGQMFYILSLQLAKAGPVSLILTTQVLFAFVFQFILFQTLPTLFGGIGASLILLCTVAIALQNMIKK